MLLVATAALMLSSGCRKSDSGKTPAEGGGRTLRIAVVPKGTTHVFWKSVHAGAERAARELGGVEILWNGPLSEGDRDGQITVIENFIANEVDGIVLAPLDRTALVPVVRRAKQAGIPTVIFDSALDKQANDLIVSYVATDNYNGGVLAARELGKRLKGKGNAILLRYTAGSESTEQREQGFLDTIHKEFPSITMLSDNQEAGVTPESALEKSMQLFNQFGSKVNGVFTVCEPVTLGMLGAIEQEGLAGKVIFIGFDPSPKAIDALERRHLHGIVLQDPVNMGYEGVKTIVAHLRGKQVPKRVPTGEYVATPENKDEPKTRKLLNPEQAG